MWWARKTDVLQGLIHFFERLAAEVRDAQKVLRLGVQQVVDRKNALLFEAIGCPDGEADFGSAHLKPLLEVFALHVGLIDGNASHLGVPSQKSKNSKWHRSRRAMRSEEYNAAADYCAVDFDKIPGILVLA